MDSPSFADYMWSVHASWGVGVDAARWGGSVGPQRLVLRREPSRGSVSRFSHETDRVGGIKPLTTHGEAFSLGPVAVVHREGRGEEVPHRHGVIYILLE